MSVVSMSNIWIPLTLKLGINPKFYLNSSMEEEKKNKDEQDIIWLTYK